MTARDISIELTKPSFRKTLKTTAISDDINIVNIDNKHKNRMKKSLKNSGKVQKVTIGFLLNPFQEHQPWQV
jgi:hypothetical protein